jgi:hypothetical protein
MSSTARVLHEGVAAAAARAADGFYSHSVSRTDMSEPFALGANELPIGPPR